MRYECECQRCSLTLFVFAALIILIYSRHLAVKSSYELQSLENEQKKLAEKNLNLDDELSRLTSPQRLKSLAKQYQFQERSQDQVLFLEMDEDASKAQ